jgi:hypothetical protein
LSGELVADQIQIALFFITHHFTSRTRSKNTIEYGMVDMIAESKQNALLRIRGREISLTPQPTTYYVFIGTGLPSKSGQWHRAKEILQSLGRA